MCRNFRVKQRHTFLERLGRAQYDPKKENFVPIMALVEDTDIEFCKNYAKCNVSDFNIFLKTLWLVYPALPKTILLPNVFSEW